MIKKDRFSLIYKWLAIVLTILVVGYILYLLSRQDFLNRKLAYLTGQSNQLLSSPIPSPRPSPKYTVPKGTENWSSYTHPILNITVRLPLDVGVSLENSDAVYFVKEDSKQLVLMKFSIRKITRKEDLDILPQPEDESALIDTLFSSQIGLVKTVTTSPISKIVLTKKSDGEIGGFPSVYFSDFYISRSSQDSSHFSNHYLVKVGDGYYLLSQGGESDQISLNAYENLFALFVSSFTMY